MDVKPAVGLRVMKFDSRIADERCHCTAQMETNSKG